MCGWMETRRLGSAVKKDAESACAHMGVCKNGRKETMPTHTHTWCCVGHTHARLGGLPEN
jgi:hypothetical protein